MIRPRRTIIVATAVAAAAALAVAVPASPAGARAVHVWRVGTWHGIRGNVPTIAAALRKARPGDWILIGPGDYHPAMDFGKAQRGSDDPAGLLVTTRDLHIRGMNRNRVVIDGTKPHAPRCSNRTADQRFGPVVKGKHVGRNGIEADETSGVVFQNFTVCNFLTGTADTGNEIWWNGGDDSGTINLGRWQGAYLSATSTYYTKKRSGAAAQYGIFISNSRGPGSVNHSYASNFSDSGYYVGACPNCRATINHAHSVNNALGYSGTNSGGELVVKNSEFAHNKTGFVTNSQNSADPPSPQNGQCPKGRTGPTGTSSCWVFIHNYVHDNNNPNVPAVGDAALGPVGNGITIAGGRNDTIAGNRFVHNGSWAVLITIFPDTDSASPNNHPNCRGGVTDGTAFGTTVPCLYDVWGNRIANNTFRNNGFYGNETNGDLADLAPPPTEKPGAPGDCFHGNKKASGAAASSWPVTLQTTQGTCGRPVYPDPASDSVLATQVICATNAFGPCPPNTAAQYPKRTHVVMRRLPRQPTMPNPCAGVPGRDPWCPH